MTTPLRMDAMRIVYSNVSSCQYRNTSASCVAPVLSENLLSYHPTRTVSFHPSDYNNLVYAYAPQVNLDVSHPPLLNDAKKQYRTLHAVLPSWATMSGIERRRNRILLFPPASLTSADRDARLLSEIQQPHETQYDALSVSHKTSANPLTPSNEPTFFAAAKAVVCMGKNTAGA